MIGIVIVNALIAVVIAGENAKQLLASPSVATVEILERNLDKSLKKTHISTGCKVESYHILTVVAHEEFQISDVPLKDISVIDHLGNSFTIERIVIQHKQGVLLLKTHVPVVHCFLFTLPLETHSTNAPLQFLHENDKQIINVFETLLYNQNSTLFIKTFSYSGLSLVTINPTTKEYIFKRLLFHKDQYMPHLGTPIFVESNGTYILLAMFVGLDQPGEMTFNAINLMSYEFLDGFTSILKSITPSNDKHLPAGPFTVEVNIHQISVEKEHTSIGCKVDSNYILTVVHSEFQVSALVRSAISIIDYSGTIITVDRIVKRNNQGILLLKTFEPLQNCSSFSLPLVWLSTNAPLQLLPENNQIINISETSPHQKYSTSFIKMFSVGLSLEEENIPRLGTPIFVESNGTYTLLAMFAGSNKPTKTINAVNFMSDKFLHRFTSTVKSLKPYGEENIWKETDVVLVEEFIDDQMCIYWGTPHKNLVIFKRKSEKAFKWEDDVWVRSSDGLRYPVYSCVQETTDDVNTRVVICVTNLYFKSSFGLSVSPSIDNSILGESIQWSQLNQYNKESNPNVLALSKYLKIGEVLKFKRDESVSHPTQMLSKLVNTNLEALVANELKLKSEVMAKFYTSKPILQNTIRIFHSNKLVTYGVVIGKNAILTMTTHRTLSRFAKGEVKIYVQDSTGPLFVDVILQYNNRDPKMVALVVLIINKNLPWEDTLGPLHTLDMHKYRILFIPRTVQGEDKPDRPYTMVNVNNSFHRYNTDVISQKLLIGMPILGMKDNVTILIGVIEHINPTLSMQQSFKIFKVTSERRIMFIKESQLMSKENLPSTIETNLMRVIRAV